MRYSGVALMTLFMMMGAVGVFLTALKWPLRTALFPIVISITFFVMAAAELCLTLFGREELAKKGAAVDFQFSESSNNALADRRALLTFMWIIGFFLIIFLFGFTIAIPLFITSYFRLYGREKWGITLMFAGLSWAFFYGLFIWLLHTTMPEGWILMQLRELGIL
ncbi:tripartite tricarboxylate transporter TctB family protein [Thermodesulfobacteriota bacterium]